ncbi:MAG: transcriptional regulator [Microbacteriaceae bacterium]|jgi:transcriptional regulator|nr:transcriptional regulator [Microbacteriaceae bacterium]
MRKTPSFLLEDPDEVKRLIRQNPWATIVANTGAGLVASHYPVLLEEDAAGISIVTHVGRPDDELLEIGENEILVIIQGPHGYISPSWYENDAFVPTWNHVTAHLYGIPQILSDDENFAVLDRLVEHFEKRMTRPASLAMDEQAARGIARGTVGLRVEVTRFDARQKLSQNKSPEVVERILHHLEHDATYGNPALAEEMRRVQPITST